jgi:hypothetical protein
LIAVATIFAAVYWQRYKSPNLPEVIPTEIAQNNLSSNSTTITWQTETPSKTEIFISKNPNSQEVLEGLKDNRDSSDSATERLTHIATVSNLTPNTPYYLKIKVNGKFYPKGDVQFKTASSSATSSANFSPIVGTIVDHSYQPVSDALVFLIIHNTYPLATGVNQNGNFILPLTNIFNTSDPTAQGIQQPIDPEYLANAVLLIQKGNEESQVELNLKPDLKPLPAIVLGENLDLRSF